MLPTSFFCSGSLTRNHSEAHSLTAEVPELLKAAHATSGLCYLVLTLGQWSRK